LERKLTDKPNVLGRVLLVVVLLVVAYAVYSFVKANNEGQAKLLPAVKAYVDGKNDGKNPDPGGLAVAADGRLLLRVSFVAGKLNDKLVGDFSRAYQGVLVSRDDAASRADFYFPTTAVGAVAARNEVTKVEIAPPAPMPTPAPPATVR